ncbi:unknown [Ruminococcus sp. CAG:379]|nr:unknown [Ruminococcus sp. CAG:379]
MHHDTGDDGIVLGGNVSQKDANQEGEDALGDVFVGKGKEQGAHEDAEALAHPGHDLQEKAPVQQLLGDGRYQAGAENHGGKLQFAAGQAEIRGVGAIAPLDQQIVHKGGKQGGCQL